MPIPIGAVAAPDHLGGSIPADVYSILQMAYLGNGCLNGGGGRKKKGPEDHEVDNIARRINSRPAVNATFAKYHSSAERIHFSPDNPLPTALVTKSLRARVREDAAVRQSRSTK